MPVEVRTASNKLTTHAKADRFDVDSQGHLFVGKWNGVNLSMIAVYAPEMWVNAVVTEADQ